MKDDIINTPFEFAVSIVDTHIANGNFVDAAEAIFLTIRGFEDEISLFSFLSKKLDVLSHHDLFKLLDEFILHIEWSRKTTNSLEVNETKNLDSFTILLSVYLFTVAKSQIEQNNIPRAIKYINKALKFQPGNEKFEKYRSYAKLELKKSSLEIYGLQNQNLSEWYGNKKFFVIDEEFALKVILLDIVRIDQTIRHDLIMSGSQISGLGDTFKEATTLYEDNDILIEIIKGNEEGILEIKVKE